MLKSLILLSVAAQVASPASAAQPTRPVEVSKSGIQPADAGTVQTLSRAQFAAKLDKAFAKLDADHDGILSPEELGAAQAEGKKALDEQFAARTAQAFARMDTNKDGMLSQAEFSAAVSTTKLPDPKATIAKLDRNHDGKVNADEFRAPQLARFDAVDANRDGSLVPRELQQARSKVAGR